MATETEKLKLVKPAGGDYVDVGVLNENMDKIDEFAQDVEDGYLPLTGGTLSGNLYTQKSDPTYSLRNQDATRIAFTKLFNSGNLQLFTSTPSYEDSAQLLITPPSLESDGKAKIRFTTNGNNTAELLGGHNFVISATTASDDMDVYLKQGTHFKWYFTNGSALNTPYKKGLVGNFVSALIMSYSNGSYGHQVAYINGTTQQFKRRLYQNTISDWEEVGGGLMSPVKVTRHTASGSYSGTGKGKLFFNADYGYTTSISSVVIDGVSIGTFSNIEIGESFEIDFTKSYSFTLNNSNASNTNVTAVFY